jgi:8-oxo-dGTP diphosphatase
MPEGPVVTEAATARFTPLRTARFTLRPLAAGDAAALHRLVNDWEVAKNLARVPFPYSRDAADEWIPRTLEQLAAGEAWNLAVVSAEDGAETLIGLVGLRRTGAREASLGYWVGRRYWGQGVAPEAVGKLARWALATLDLDRIIACVLPDNARSQAVLRRLGFRDDGAGEEEFLSRGGRMAVLRFVATHADLAEQVAPMDTAPALGAVAGKPLLLVAACALIDSDGRVLLARRPEGKSLAGLWEFPGGKLRPGETPEAALIRELAEELAIDVQAACLAPFAFASHGYEGFHLLMPLYLCRRWNGLARPTEGQTLAWVRPGKLADYPMPPADRPLVALLRDFL